MLASERTRYIISQLHSKGIINLKDIAKELNISEATVRRDFEKLENEGKLTRVTGGAKLNEHGEEAPVINSAELTMRAKKNLNYDAKLRVARRACDYIEDGECVYLDGGTSIAVMAEFLEKRPIQIFTHSELLVRSMNNPVADIFLIGGTYLPHYGVSVGPMTQEMIQKLHFDKVFVSCTCADISEDCSYVNEFLTLAVKNTAIANSDKAYLLMDAGKLNRRSFCKLRALSEFEKVFCNSGEALPDPLPTNFEIL